MSLADLGGVAGLARWCRLYESHPRVMSAIWYRYRVSGTHPTAALYEVAAAIENWVAAHRRTTEWAKRGANFPHALALRVGSSFAGFCGDPEAWAGQLWDSYNGQKHNPSFTLATAETRLLADSGYLLLVSALLDRIASTKTPSRQLLNHPGRRRFGERLRSTLGLDA